VEDIPLLVDHFNTRFSKEQGQRPLRIPARVMDALIAYPWPGNVRELENLVHRLIILKGGSVEMDDLPPHLKMEPPRGTDAGPLVTLAEMERRHIQRVLEATGNNKTKAAAVLGIDRKTLREKLKEPGHITPGGES
jgi:two-component system response regulator HydG